MKKILIVDDEYIPNQAQPHGNYMWYYVKALQEADLQVTSAAGPKAAKTKLLRRPDFSLVILDLMMPADDHGPNDAPEQLAMSGVLFSEWMTGSGIRIPIVVLTNTKAPGIHKRLKTHVPADRIFIKPETTPFAFVKQVVKLINP